MMRGGGIAVLGFEDDRLVAGHVGVVVPFVLGPVRDEQRFKAPFLAVGFVKDRVGDDQVLRCEAARVAQRQRHILRRGRQRAPDVDRDKALERAAVGAGFGHRRRAAIGDVDMGKARRVRIVRRSRQAGRLGKAQDAAWGDPHFVGAGGGLHQRGDFGDIGRGELRFIGKVGDGAGVGGEDEPFAVEFARHAARAVHGHGKGHDVDLIAIMRVGVIARSGDAAPGIGDVGCDGHALVLCWGGQVSA